MCGICGAIGFQSSETGEAIVRRMMAAIIHRGPDEEGFLIVHGAAAGTRRLSIIDLPGGSQPIWNKTGTLAVLFNGEIYNFRELRNELESAGHEFQTRSDTEVIVHAYEAWGEKCVQRLRGMFAFAIVEMPQGRSGARCPRVHRSRSPWHQAALLHHRGRTFSFRVGSARAAGKQLRPSPAFGRCTHFLSPLRLRLRADDPRRRRCISSARPLHDNFRRRASPRPRAKILLADCR